MPRTRRAYTASSVLRIWTYLERQDREYVLCWFKRLHDERVARITLPPGFIGTLTGALERLGLTGRIAAATISALDAIRPADVLQCEDTLRRGGT